MSTLAHRIRAAVEKHAAAAEARLERIRAEYAVARTERERRGTLPSDNAKGGSP